MNHTLNGDNQESRKISDSKNLFTENVNQLNVPKLQLSSKYNSKVTTISIENINNTNNSS